ncbi:unnamed protein product [Lota lota]
MCETPRDAEKTRDRRKETASRDPMSGPTKATPTADGQISLIIRTRNNGTPQKTVSSHPEGRKGRERRKSHLTEKPVEGRGAGRARYGLLTEKCKHCRPEERQKLGTGLREWETAPSP